MTSASPLPDEGLVRTALRLLVTAEASEPATAARARQRLAGWIDRSAEHAAAHAEALRRWQALAGAAAGLRGEWTDPIEASARRTHASRTVGRRALLGLALVAGGGAAARVGWQWHVAQPLYAAGWQTRTAELLRVLLPDADASHAATEILLSARTALRATLYRDRREITLDDGEARFDVRADASRPFHVRTGVGRVAVVGTRFTVASREGRMTVAVDHGQVRVYPSPPASAADRPAGFVTLAPGESLSLRAGEPPGAVRRVAAADFGAWGTGWLVFEDVALADALPSINAFRQRPLTLAEGPGGAQAGALRLTARFRTADERGLPGALPAILPVRIDPQADGRLVVTLRRPPAS